MRSSRATKRFSHRTFAVVGALALSPATIAAEDLVFGMSTALSGPAAEVGLAMRAGVETAFAEQNDAGGVDGRPLRLVALDDGYEPGRAAPNVRELIADRGVLGIIGNVGTPTAVVAAPLAIEHNTLFFAAYTGAGILRKNPADRCVFNFRASYAEETAAMVAALLEHTDITPADIAFFTQRDAYGDAGYAGGMTALREHGLDASAPVVHCRYERNTVNVESAMSEILMADRAVRAIIMVGAYEPCAAFIRLARETGVDALFLNVSFVGADSLCRALGDAGEGVIITQVVPHYDSDAPVAARFRSALATHGHATAPSFASFEGYLAARILQRALASIPTAIDRAAVVEAFERMGSFDIGLTFPLRLSDTHHQACDRVWPTIIRSRRVEPMEWSDLKAGER